VVLQSLIQAGQQATRVNSTDPLNWRTLAAIYENNIAIVGGSDKFAVSNYTEAARRNTQNPAEYLNVARAYVRSADNIQNQINRLQRSGETVSDEDIGRAMAERANSLENALENIQKAISLKGDYASAHFLSSQIYERQGNRALAIQKTLETRNLNPFDTGVGYQLGLLYYLDNQTEKARGEFERVISLSSTFSNARYFLGLAYDRLGERARAIEQFEKIAEFNPENSEVERILKNLKGGEEALYRIVPPALPPQERIKPPLDDTGGAGSETILEDEE